jgi:hypothetical protein
MTTVTLRALVAGIEARKAAAGMIDTPAVVEAMRNKGARRTPEKRELLRRAETRAKAAGRQPIPAHF